VGDLAEHLPQLGELGRVTGPEYRAHDDLERDGPRLAVHADGLADRPARHPLLGLLADDLLVTADRLPVERRQQALARGHVLVLVENKDAP
jgi:hypothetical protein